MLINQFCVTSWFDSVCVVVTRLENIRQTIYLKMNYSFLTAMNERDFRIQTVVTSYGSVKVTYHENYFKQKFK